MVNPFINMPDDVDQLVSSLVDFLQNRLPQEAAAKIQEVIQTSFDKEQYQGPQSMYH